MQKLSTVLVKHFRIQSSSKSRIWVANYAQRLDRTIRFIPTFESMKQIAIVGFLGLFLTMAQSCQMAKCGATKDIFLRNFDDFIEKVDEADLDISDDRWEAHDEKFRGYVEECYDAFEDDLSSREKRKFWIKSLKYYSTRYGDGMLNELSKDDITNQRVRDQMEQVLEETGHDIEQFLEQSADELEALFEDIGKDIESWAQRIKEIFEEE